MRFTLFLLVAFLFYGSISAQQLQYQNHEMEYDDLNRLTKVFFSNGIVHEYVYDNLGNRLERLVYEAPKTYVPDDAFEQHLIDEGYDLVMDDYVYTHKIDDIEELFMNSLGIEDLTGIEDFEALENLSCANNNLDTVDISTNTNLKQLWCSHNNLTALDITMLTNLFIIDCGYNDIATLDLTDNLLLQHIGIGSTLIESLDLSAHSNITWFEAINGQLESLNLENGNNNIIIYMHAGNNPNLYCIQVDDENAANNGTGVYNNWVKDGLAEYSEDCDALGLNEFGLPFDNYTINAIGLTCINSGDGVINVQAEKPRDYTVQIVSDENNINDSFQMNQSNNLEIYEDYFEGGEYFIYITIDDISEDVYKKTFILNLDEPEPLEATSRMANNGNRFTLEMTTGTPPFTIKLNDEMIGTTSESEYTFEANHGDIVEVSTAKACEGKYIETLSVLDAIALHPNPTSDKIYFSIPAIENGTAIILQLYDVNGRIVGEFAPVIGNQKIEISIQHLPTGVYVANFPAFGDTTFKIVKE